MDPRKDQFGRCIQKVPTITTSTNCVTSQPVPQMITDRQSALSMPLTSTNQGQPSESSKTPSKSGSGSETSEALPVSIQAAHGPSLSQIDKYMQASIARTSVSHSPNRTSTDGLNTCKSDQNCTTVCANSELSDSKRQSVALPASITSSRVGGLSRTDDGAVAFRNAVQYQEVVNPGEQTIPPRTIPTTIISKAVSHKGVVVAPKSPHVSSQSVPPAKEDTVKNIPPTRTIITRLDPRLKASPSAGTRSQPKSASSNSGGKPNEQSATAFQNALSDLSMALSLLAKQRGTKTAGLSPNVSASANGTHKTAHKRMQSGNESTVQSDSVSTATSLGAKFTTNPVSCSAPKSAKSPEKMVHENVSRKPFQVSSQQCSPQKVMVRSPSKSPSGTQTVVRDPRLSSKLYSTIASERQTVSPVAPFHPSPVIGHSPVKQSSNDARYGVFSNHQEDPINSATPGATVPLPTRFNPQKRRMDTLLQPKLAFKSTSHSGMWPGSRYHLNSSSNLTSSKAAPTNMSGEAKEVVNLPSSCPWKAGTTTSVGSGRIREDDTSPSNTSSPTRKAPGFGYSVSESTVTEQLPGKPNEMSKSSLSKEVRLSPNNKKTEPNLTSAGTAALTVESKGHTKLPRSKFQKSRSFVHPRSQPSFLELLRIASRNTAKGKHFGDSLNLQDSRRRRHSDGQINKRKFSEVGSKMNPDDLSYYKIQKLEKISGQTETVFETSRTVTSDDDQRTHSSGAETPDPSVKGKDEPMSASRALVDSDGQLMRRKSSSEGEEPTVAPPTNHAASPTEAGPVLTSGELMCDNGSSALLKSSRSPYFEKAINAAEDSHSQKNTEELEIAPSSMPETYADKERGNQGSSVVPAGTSSSECQAEGQVTDGDVPTATDTREEELQQMEEDDGISDGVDDSGSDDDDSFLMGTPSALIPDTSALVDAPMPVTPSKPSTSNMNFSPSPKVQSHLNFEPQPKKIGYTLDKMLHMKNDQELKNGDIATIRSKLMKVVSEGGIAQLASETLTEDERYMDAATEYAQYLAQCMPQLEKIPDSPPGEEIFCQEKVQQLFTPSQCLVAANWGVTRSSSVGDALCDATEDEMEEFIQTGFFDCFYSRSQIPLDIMRWMFLLMSIHPSSMESQILYNTLWGQLNKASLSLEELEFPWTPSLKDIITVMINYGGDLASLVSVSDCEVNFSEDDLRLETSHSTENRDGYWKDEEVYGLLLENHIGSVVKIITQAIITYITLKDCSGYRTEELQCLLIIMFRIALDKHILGLPVTVDISNAISTILEGFEESVWSHQVERLCLLFPLITGHHHNMVYLLQSCIPLHIERGRCLYRMLGFAGLQNLVFPEKGLCNMAEEQDMKVSRLIPILHCCKPSTETDYYQLHSIILLLDFSIGNEILSASERMDLDQIIKKLREMVGEIRDNSLSMSMSQVKSLIVRTATKLSFMTQAMVTKQEGVFSFLRRDNTESLELPEHHVSSQTDGASLPSEDESSAEMEDEEDEPTRSKDTGWSEDVEHKLSGSENKASKPSEGVDSVPEIVQAGASCPPNDINIENEPANLTLDGEVVTSSATGTKIKEEELGAESPAKKLKVGTVDNLNESVPPIAANKTGQLVENFEAETSLPISRTKTDVIDLTCSDEDNDNDDDSIECVN